MNDGEWRCFIQCSGFTTVRKTFISASLAVKLQEAAQKQLGPKEVQKI
jgi:hypothetical protein